MAIGERLSELRKRNGLSQEELAERMGLTRQTISKWELGQSSPDIEYVIALCECFDVSSDYLLRGIEPALKEESSEEDSAVHPTPDNAQRKKTGAFSMLFYLGLALTILACGCLFVLLVLSLIQPWTTDSNGTIYTGFWGYILGHNAQLWVYLLLTFLAGGIWLSVFSVIKKLKTNRKGTEVGKGIAYEANHK